jgi:hypothetical protein
VNEDPHLLSPAHSLSGKGLAWSAGLALPFWVLAAALALRACG